MGEEGRERKKRKGRKEEKEGLCISTGSVPLSRPNSADFPGIVVEERPSLLKLLDDLV